MQIHTIPPINLRDREVLMQNLPFGLVKLFHSSKVDPR
jgi:hypothetical protein